MGEFLNGLWQTQLAFCARLVFISLRNCNKIAQTECNGNLILILGRPTNPQLRQQWIGAQCRPASRLRASTLLMSPHDGRGKTCEASLIKALIPLWKLICQSPHHIPEPHLLRASHWWLGFNNEFWFSWGKQMPESKLYTVLLILISRANQCPKSQKNKNNHEYMWRLEDSYPRLCRCHAYFYSSFPRLLTSTELFVCLPKQSQLINFKTGIL
jgi:hypothetical protein